MTKIIFVGGTGRSGTSITKDIIARHPDAASLPFEYRFIIDPDGLVDFYTSMSSSWSPYLADRRLKRLKQLLDRLSHYPLRYKVLDKVVRTLDPGGRILSPSQYSGYELAKHLPNWEKHVEVLLFRLGFFPISASWVGTESYQRRSELHLGFPHDKGSLVSLIRLFIRNVINDLLDAQGKDFFVEDNTWNILFAKELLELVPDAYIVHVYRDPRDVVCSMSHQRWCPKEKRLCAIWVRDIWTRWNQIRKYLSSNHYIEIALEDLVTKPEQTLQSLCVFLNIALHQSMVDVDLSKSHSGRWKYEFTEAENEVVGFILGDLIEELGYD